MIEAWRLVKAKWAESAFSGEGARVAGGRWGSVGTPLVYTSESLALAELEVLVNLPTERLLGSYVAFRVRFDEGLVEELRAEALPEDWRRSPAPRSTQAVGDRWVREGRSLVLRVPSAVVPAESNYLLNPAHRDGGRLEVEGPLDPLLDPRLG
jgi:RES domain-containing protein